MNPCEESLLPASGNERANVHIKFNNGVASTRSRRSLSLLAMSLFIFTCLAVYLYLNMQAIEGPQSSVNRFKPLSRRKPMLDHESIFSDSGPSMIKLSDLFVHCLVALKIAGRQVVEMSLAHNDKIAHVGSKGLTLEGVDDVVTGADLKSHHMIMSTIKDSYRRLRVVSEEDTTQDFEAIRVEEDILPIKRSEFAQMLRRSQGALGDTHNVLVAQHETLVWIDPLDATKEYSENLTDYVTLMACIVHKGRPIAGVIHKPFKNQTFWSLLDPASKTHSHSADLLRLIEARPVASEGPPRAIVSRSHAGDVKQVLAALYGPQADIISAGGSGYKTLELIGGRADVYLHLTRIKKWDICAPDAILRSLPDGVMSDLSGAPIGFGEPSEQVVNAGLIATLKPALHHSLLEALRRRQNSDKHQ